MSWKATPRAMPVTSSAAASANSGPSSRSICVLSQRSSRVCTASRDAPVSCSSAITRTRGRNTSSPAIELADRRADPAHGAVGVEHELALRRLLQLGGARIDLAGQRGARGSLQRLRFGARRRRVGDKREAVETADLVPLNDNFAGLFDFSFQCRVLAQPPHQHAGAPVDEPLGKTLMQRIRELVLDAPRDGLPMLGIGKPVRTVRHEGPGPHMRDPVRQRVDIAVGPVGLRHLGGKPIGGDFTLPHQESIEGDDQFCVRCRRDLAVVGHLTHVPQPLDCGFVRRHRADFFIARSMFEHQDVFGDRRAREPLLRRASAPATPAAHRSTKNPDRCCAIAAP